VVAIQIRDVPDDVRDALAAKAAARGQSLQAYLLQLVTDEATKLSNIEIITRLRATGGGSHMTPEEAANVIRDARRLEGRE
jgi:plasmid stability protein